MKSEAKTPGNRHPQAHGPRSRLILLLSLIFVLCALPGCANWFGFTFESGHQHQGTLEQLSDLPGPLHHALLEWTSVIIALLAVVFGALHLRVHRDPAVGIIVLTLLTSGSVDAFHSLASMGLIQSVAPQADFVPFTWAFARIFNAGGLLFGLGALISLRQPQLKGNGSWVLSMSAVVLIGTAVAGMFWLAASASLPKTTYDQSVASRPFDVLPLTMFALCGALAWSYDRARRDRLLLGVFLAMLPAVASQAHMAFGSAALFDNDFNIAHALKALSYGVLLFAILGDFTGAPEVDGTQVNSDRHSLSLPRATQELALGRAARPLGVTLPLTAFLLTLGLTGIVGLGFYGESEKLVRHATEHQVSEQSQILAPLIESIFHDSEAELIFLSKTPAVGGIVGTRQAEPPLDIDLAPRTALEEVLVGMLQSVQSFSQIRYVQVTSGAPQEIARVKRTATGLVRVPSSRLHTPSRLESILTASAYDPDQVSYSSLHEGSDATLSYSIAVPVFDRQRGVLDGVLQADIGFSGAIRARTQSLLPGVVFVVATRTGRIIYDHSGELDARSLEEVFPGSDGFWADERTSTLLDPEQRPLAQLAVIGQGSQRPRLLLAVGYPLEQAHETLVAFRNKALLVGAALSLLALAAAIFVTARLVLPLRQLSDALRHHGTKGWLGKLPIEAKDEVGVLARGFHNLFGQLEGAIQQQRIALLSAQNQRQALDEHAIVAMTDVKGSIIYANERFCSISGYSSDELLGDNHNVVASGCHDDEFWREMYTTISKGRTWHQEICNRRKDGTLYWVDGTIVPFMNEEGRPESYVSIATEITERVLAERELARSVALLGATLEATVDGILVTSRTGEVLQTNARFCELFKTNKNTVQKGDGATLRRHISEQLVDGELVNQGEARLRLHPNEHFTEVLMFKDGRIYERDSRAMLIHGKAEGFVFSFRDVTNRVRSQEELVAAKEAAEDASRQKADFLASMSHEIRTPMNGVLGMLGLLMDGHLAPEQRHEAELAHSSAEALLGLINDILDFSKVEAGKLELEEIDFDICTELGEFAEAMALRCEDKGLELVLDLSEVEYQRVNGDPGRVRQVLMNLVGNAIKFTDAGEVVLRVAIEEEGEGLLLSASVSDQGIGIPQEKVATLFDKFTQVDASTTRKYGGSGLGLAIVGQLCTLMSGDVRVESVLGEGSTFSFSLRLGKVAGAAPLSQLHNLSGRKVLVIDDSKAIRRAMTSLMSVWGASCQAASTINLGKQALSHAEGTDFHYVFVDDELPPQQVQEFTRTLRSAAPQTRIIAMTTLRGRSRGGDFESNGFCASFPKPITLNDLARSLLTTDSSTELPEGVPSAVPQAPGLHHRGTSLRLLLVEDNPVNQKVAKGTLKRLGFNLTDVAANGFEAIEALKSAPEHAPYDLILMDCQMPEMDGYEAVRRIRQGQGGARYKDLPVIAMTANAMTGDREKCIGAGMNDYLSKPVQRGALRETLLKWVPGLDSLAADGRTEPEDGVSDKT